MKSYIKMLKQYTDFYGRAGRKEFWVSVWTHSFVIALLLFIDEITDFRHDSGIGLISSIYTLATALPSLAVRVRRLHDVGRSGAWLALHFVPIIGHIILLIFYCLDSVPCNNKWGRCEHYNF